MHVLSPFAMGTETSSMVRMVRMTEGAHDAPMTAQASFGEYVAERRMADTLCPGERSAAIVH